MCCANCLLWRCKHIGLELNNVFILPRSIIQNFWACSPRAPCSKQLGEFRNGRGKKRYACDCCLAWNHEIYSPEKMTYRINAWCKPSYWPGNPFWKNKMLLVLPGTCAPKYHVRIWTFCAGTKFKSRIVVCMEQCRKSGSSSQINLPDITIKSPQAETCPIRIGVPNRGYAERALFMCKP